MALETITPTHEALHILRQTIKNLELQYHALAATLPTPDKNNKSEKGGRFLTHPITGKKRAY